MEACVDPVAPYGRVCAGGSQQKGMPWFPAEMFKDGARAEAMGRSVRPSGNLQYLAECADGMSGSLGRVIHAGIRHHDDPQRVAPTGIIVGRE